MDANKSPNQSPHAGITLFTAVMVVAIVVGASWSQTVQAEPKKSPRDFLIGMSAEVTAKLKKNDSGAQKNDINNVYKIIDVNILPNLDCITMTKLALGSNWAHVNEENRIKYVIAFMKLLTITYGKALNEYRNQKINFLSPKLPEDTLVASVKAEIDRPDGPSIPMLYRLRVKDNAWKIYDIKIDGFSLVTSFRGTFRQVVRQNDIDYLLEYMGDKNSKLPTMKKLDAENHNDICTADK